MINIWQQTLNTTNEYDTAWKLQTEYDIWKNYILSSKKHNYKIDILEKTTK